MARGYYSDAFKLQLTPPKENIGTELGKMFVNLGTLAETNYQNRLKQQQAQEALDLRNAFTQANIEHLKTSDELAQKKENRQSAADELSMLVTGNMLADKGALSELPNYQSFDDFSKRFSLNDPKSIMLARDYYDQNKKLATDDEFNMIMAGVLEQTGGVIPTAEQQKAINEKLKASGYFDKYPDAMVKVNDTINQMRIKEKKSDEWAPTALMKNAAAINADRARRGLPPLSTEQVAQFMKMTGKYNQAELLNQEENKLAKLYGKDAPAQFYDDYMEGKITYDDIRSNKEASQLLRELARKNKVALRDTLPKDEFDTLRAIRSTNDVIGILNKDTDFRKNYGIINNATDWVQKYVNLDDDAKARAQKYFMDSMLKSAAINANIKGVPSNKDMELISKGLADTAYTPEQAAELYKAALEKNLITIRRIYANNKTALPQLILNYGDEEQRILDSIKMIDTVFGLKGDDKESSLKSAWESAKVPAGGTITKENPPAEDRSGLIDNATGLPKFIREKTTGQIKMLVNGQYIPVAKKDGQWVPVQ